MKASIIAPTGLLNRYSKRTNYHLCLAHLVLSDDKYAEFYRTRSEAGDFVILDNSVVELKRPVEFNELKEAALRVNPTEIVLPDYPGDAGQTFQAAKLMGPKFLHAIPRVKLMAVPQGLTVNSWFTSYVALCTLEEVTAIGIGKYLKEKRPDVVRELGKGRSDRDYHLLGTWGNPIEVRRLALGAAWLRGVDTKLPVRLGQRGIALHPDEGMLSSIRPEPLNFENPRDPLPVVTDHNVKTFIGWAQGEAEVVELFGTRTNT